MGYNNWLRPSRARPSVSVGPYAPYRFNTTPVDDTGVIRHDLDPPDMLQTHLREFKIPSAGLLASFEPVQVALPRSSALLDLKTVSAHDMVKKALAFPNCALTMTYLAGGVVRSKFVGADTLIATYVATGYSESTLNPSMYHKGPTSTVAGFLSFVRRTYDQMRKLGTTLVTNAFGGMELFQTTFKILGGKLSSYAFNPSFQNPSPNNITFSLADLGQMADIEHLISRNWQFSKGSGYQPIGRDARGVGTIALQQTATTLLSDRITGYAVLFAFYHINGSDAGNRQLAHTGRYRKDPLNVREIYDDPSTKRVVSLLDAVASNQSRSGATPATVGDVQDFMLGMITGKLEPIGDPIKQLFSTKSDILKKQHFSFDNKQWYSQDPDSLPDKQSRQYMFQNYMPLYSFIWKLIEMETGHAWRNTSLLRKSYSHVVGQAFDLAPEIAEGDKQYYGAYNGSDPVLYRRLPLLRALKMMERVPCRIIVFT